MYSTQHLPYITMISKKKLQIPGGQLMCGSETSQSIAAVTVDASWWEHEHSTKESFAC